MKDGVKSSSPKSLLDVRLSPDHSKHRVISGKDETAVKGVEEATGVWILTEVQSLCIDLYSRYSSVSFRRESR